MITLQSCWDDFKKVVYPDGMFPDQERQVKNAFFAGAEITFEHLGLASSQNNEDEAFKIFSNFQKEILQHVDTIKQHGKQN